MTRLSVNINKIATLRNSRGGNVPDVQKAAVACEQYGAEGITVHPRPDERHIRYSDVRLLRPLVKTEFNIEGYPSRRFMDLVLEVKPEQVTLVPDSHDQITSNRGWDVKNNLSLLTDIIREFKKAGIRVSVFVDPDEEQVEAAALTGTDRIELYTEPYAVLFPENPDKAIAPYVRAALRAQKVGLGVNAGHDLNLDNLNYFYTHIPGLLEVSIGHALISDALYMGLEKTIQEYLKRLR